VWETASSTRRIALGEWLKLSLLVAAFFSLFILNMRLAQIAVPVTVYIVTFILLIALVGWQVRTSVRKKAMTYKFFPQGIIIEPGRAWNPYQQLQSPTIRRTFTDRLAKTGTIQAGQLRMTGIQMPEQVAQYLGQLIQQYQGGYT